MTKDAVETRAAAGERRLVTVLFCDLVGSTVLSQRLDQEDYAEIVLSYQETVRGVIERNGGAVANYSGDGVVGQFGFPDSHENDAERAVVSGLEICDLVIELDRTLGAELGERIQCRIGLHASVSVVGMMGAYRQDMSIFGDTANIASRVEGVAGPGQVVATGAVLELLKGDFETADQQIVELKGVADPMPVARIVGRAVTTVSTAAIAHIGRASVLSDLAGFWDQARAGKGTFVTLSADAGIGKSAALQAFLSDLDDPIVVSARGRSLNMAQPFGVLGQLADACLVHARFEPDGAERRAAEQVRSLLDMSDATASSAEERWQELFEAGMNMLQTLQGQPVIVVIEDLHWTDSSTEELIERYAKQIGEEPTLLVTTTRPGPRLGTATVIELEPLSEQEMRTLVQANATVELPAALIDDIVRRAQGVPLFAVELARGATADAAAALPESLQASLLARLAQRPELARVAQVASVLGDVVDVALLSTLLESSSETVAGHITALDGDHVLEIDANGACQFTHSLLREAIYGSMLRRERRTLHQAAAAALTHEGARDDSRISIVGHHLALGARRLDAAGCYDIAARRAAALGAFHDAVELADQGIAALGQDPEPSSELLGLTMTRGNAANAATGYSAPGLYELWCHAEAIAEATGNRLEQSSGMNGQSVIALFDGNYALAIERADRIVAFGDEYDDRPALVRGYCSRALPQLYSGSVAEALVSAERAGDLYRDGDYELLTYGFGTDHLSIAHTTAATAAHFAGDPREAEFSRLAIEHARMIESPITLAMSHNSAATLALFGEDPELAVHHVDQVWDICDRFGLPFFRMVTTLTKSAALAMLGDQSATKMAYAALDDAEGGANLALTLGIYSVARSEEATGNLEGAYDLAEMGLAIAEQNDERLLEVELLCMQLRCRQNLEATERLTAALPMAHTRGARGSVQRAEQVLETL